MSTKVSPRHKKLRSKDDIKQEIVAQVHKPNKRDDVGSDKEANRTENSEESSGSNRTYFLEDKNENYSVHTPSREISVDGETQINSKIISLIESEMKRDINKQNHFTDSRPQSLSFYEEEKMPEELSGNLELLSPEEKKHYKKRKDYIDMDERNAYNAIQDIYNRENEEILMNGSLKKSKSRKKRHGENETGLGDSREMMIPKEKKKSKKKRRDCSPVSSSSNKKKHRKKDDEYEPRNDITIALEELQDDVFENNQEDHVRHEKMKKSPRKSDKVYVQRKNKFEVVSRGAGDKKNPESNIDKTFADLAPIEVAVAVQKRWIPMTNFCHGLLAGLALAHLVLIKSSNSLEVQNYMEYIASFNEFYDCLFYILVVICTVSVMDRLDFAHWNVFHVSYIYQNKRSLLIIIFYLVALVLHLSAAHIDSKITMLSSHDNETHINITESEMITWISMSSWKDAFAFFGWMGVGIGSSEDMLLSHLKNMVQYAHLDNN